MILDQKRVTPRKAWTCSGCDRRFAKGVEHETVKWRDLGSVETVRTCDTCVAFWIAFDPPLDGTISVADLRATWPDEWETYRSKLEGKR